MLNVNPYLLIKKYEYKDLLNGGEKKK